MKGPRRQRHKRLYDESFYCAVPRNGKSFSRRRFFIASLPGLITRTATKRKLKTFPVIDNLIFVFILFLFFFRVHGAKSG